MNSVQVVHNGTKHPTYKVFCPDCGFDYPTFEDTHYCENRKATIDIDGMIVPTEVSDEPTT